MLQPKRMREFNSLSHIFNIRYIDPIPICFSWCRQLGLGPGSRIVDVRALPLTPIAGYHRFDINNNREHELDE